MKLAVSVSLCPSSLLHKSVYISVRRTVICILYIIQKWAETGPGNHEEKVFPVFSLKPHIKAMGHNWGREGEVLKETSGRSDTFWVFRYLTSWLVEERTRPHIVLERSCSRPLCGGNCRGFSQSKQRPARGPLSLLPLCCCKGNNTTHYQMSKAEANSLQIVFLNCGCFYLDACIYHTCINMLI